MGSRWLDVLVAERVMGWKGVGQDPIGCGWFDDRGRQLPTYHNDLLAAWDVVEALRDQGWHVEIEMRSDDLRWEVRAEHDNGKYALGMGRICVAICDAALKAIGMKPAVND